MSFKEYVANSSLI